MEDAETVVTELIANAAQHARYDTVRLSVRRTERGGVRVAVTDRSRAEPVLCRPRPSAEGGRGMPLSTPCPCGGGTFRCRGGSPYGPKVEAAER
ncbi:ATP-binding protein [Streptomyces sp. NPDC017230]|uniref:ATP-binding protein n=1 Tax=unclassified Streptomyces TaxID=2593676 RepID=UPI00379DA9B2